MNLSFGPFARVRNGVSQGEKKERGFVITWHRAERRDNRGNSAPLLLVLTKWRPAAILECSCSATWTADKDRRDVPSVLVRVRARSRCVRENVVPFGATWGPAQDRTAERDGEVADVPPETPVAPNVAQFHIAHRGYQLDPRYGQSPLRELNCYKLNYAVR